MQMITSNQQTVGRFWITKVAHGAPILLAMLLALGAMSVSEAATGDNPDVGGANALQSAPAAGFDPGRGLNFPDLGGRDNTAISIHRDPDDLPDAARQMRDDLMAAARTGDISELGPLFARQNAQPQLTFDLVGDPVKFLRDTSNDGEGRETMAIMLELLEAPYATFNEGTDDELYVWPYLAALDLETLDPTQLIDLYKIVSHQDLEEMQLFGAWFFYRVSISAKGEWLSFVAGD